MLTDILVIIPVLDEEQTIADVIQMLQQQGLNNICVVDNGSCDRTAVIATQAGAQVIVESRQGYGQACWCGLQWARAQFEWILFCDGDGSDDLSQLGDLLALRADYDLILGNRRGSVEGRSQLTPAQNFGNWLATRLIKWGWGYTYEDLGPLRLIRKSAVDRLAMRDRGYGWTVEMQAKAVVNRLRICERPVNYLPRQGGHSKISGTLKGSFKAGLIILITLAGLYWQQRWQQVSAPIWRRLSKFGKSAAVQTTLRWLSAFSLIFGSVWAMPHGDFLNQPNAVPSFWQGVGLMCLGFTASWGLKKVTGSWFWSVALGSRLILLMMYPGDDIWRYLWEGHIQTVGFNPYLLAPNAGELAPLRFVWWTQINHLDHAAIYPPAAQLGFRLLAAIRPSVLLFKLSFVAADIGICWLLNRRFGYRATLLYAWNPLVIYSFAGGGHYDSWFLLPLVAAWLWWDSIEQVPSEGKNRQQWQSVLAIGLSIAVKWMSLPMLLFMALRQQLQNRASQGLVSGIVAGGLVFGLGLLPLAIAAVPFCQGLSCPILPLESSFVSYGRSANLVPQLVAQLWPASVYANWIYAVPLGSVIFWNLRKTKRLGPFTERYFTALMLLSPVIHAWYFTWLVPFAVASRSLGTRLVSLSAFVYFSLPYGLALNAENAWTLSAPQRWALWGPFVIGWVLQKPCSGDDKISRK